MPTYGNTLLGPNQSLQNSINTIVGEFRLKRQDSGITRRLATQYKLEPHTGTTKYIDYYNQLSAYALTDGVDMQQAQTLQDNQVSYTPGEIGVQLIIADTTIRRSADPDLMTRAGRIAANAVDLKEDQDGCAQAANFTAGGAGGIPGTGVVYSVGAVASARSRLRTGNQTPAMPAPQPYYGVFHPYTLQALVGRMIPLAPAVASTTAYTTTSAGAGAGPGAGGRSGATDDMMRGGVKALSRVSDVDIFEDANVSLSGNDAKNFIFSKEGFVYVLELDPYYAAQRDESLRATELNIVCSYVFGTYLGANYGVYALADASTPTN